MAPYVAQSLDQMPTFADLTSRTGLEFMQAIIDGALAGPNIGATLGFAPTYVEKGKAVFEGSAGFGTLNPMRGVHGGWYGAILDSCMGCAVMTLLEKGQIYTTLEYKINITRALPMDMPAVATGTLQHGGRRTAVARGELRGREDGKLYATGATTCLVMDT